MFEQWICCRLTVIIGVFPPGVHKKFFLKTHAPGLN